jgi:hypothetical protein
MANKGIQKKVGSLIDDGRIDEAADLLLEAWMEHEGEIPSSLAALIDKISEISPKAAYMKAFILTEEQDEEAERFFRLASECEDGGVSGPANMSLTSIYMERGRDDLALPYLRKAVEHDVPMARHMLSLAYVWGKMGLKIDISEAVHLLEGLIKDEYSEAKVTLAQLIIAKKAKLPNVDPFQLIAEAAADGVEEAITMLLDLGKGLSEAPGNEEPMLPYVVIPDGMKRPKLVRDALVSEFGMTRDQSEELTAGLYGYSKWSVLTRAATDPKVKKGKFDEDMEPAELNERNQLLTSVLCYYIEIEDYIADIAINLLKPTARNGRPTLKKLQERVNSCMIPVGSRTISTNMNRLVDQIGVGGDLEKSMRTASPARADVWLEMLSSHLGWKFEEVDAKADADGAWIGRTLTKSRKTFEVFISRALFTPGDQGDDHIFKIRRSIEERADNAILLFSKPLVHLPEPRKDRGVLFGGLIFDDGKWNEFMLRPGGGIDDAVDHQLTIEEEMNPNDVSQFIFDGAGSLGQLIASYVNDADPRDKNGYIPFGTINGWTNFIPAELAKMMKGMM